MLQTELQRCGVFGKCGRSEVLIPGGGAKEVCLAVLAQGALADFNGNGLQAE